MKDRTKQGEASTPVLKRVKLEDAADVPPPSRPPTCVTIGSIDEVLGGRTMEQFIKDAETTDAKHTGE